MCQLDKIRLGPIKLAGISGTGRQPGRRHETAGWTACGPRSAPTPGRVSPRTGPGPLAPARNKRPPGQEPRRFNAPPPRARPAPPPCGPAPALHRCWRSSGSGVPAGRQPPARGAPGAAPTGGVSGCPAPGCGRCCPTLISTSNSANPAPGRPLPSRCQAHTVGSCCGPVL